MSATAAPAPLKILSVALQIIGPEKPRQTKAVGIDDAILIAADGSSHSPMKMLGTFCESQLRNVFFAKGRRHIVSLGLEGGLYRLQPEIFPGRFELFGVIFLFEGITSKRAANAADPPPSMLTEQLSIDDENALVLSLQTTPTKGAAL